MADAEAICEAVARGMTRRAASVREPSSVPPTVLIKIHPIDGRHSRAIKPAGRVATGAGRAASAARSGARMISLSNSGWRSQTQPISPCQPSVEIVLRLT
jgi:hypothetical protein